MFSLEELKKQKERLENALKDVEVALSHPEYVNPFEFKRMDRITDKDLNHPSMKSLLIKCIDNGSGFDPSLITQHIESVALDRFNKMVLAELENLSIKDLMTVRHEMELLMLNERNEHYRGELAKIDGMLLELESVVDDKIIILDEVVDNKVIESITTAGKKKGK